MMVDFDAVKAVVARASGKTWCCGLECTVDGAIFAADDTLILPVASDVEDEDAAAIVGLMNWARGGGLAQFEQMREALQEVRDGLGCQPGYVNTLVLQHVSAALAATASAKADDGNLLKAADARSLVRQIGKIVQVWRDDENESPTDTLLQIDAALRAALAATRGR